MHRQAWFFLVVFVAANSIQTASADNNQGSVADYSGKKELPQISANPRKAPQNAPQPGSNTDNKKTSKPNTSPEEPEINIGGWDRGGEMPKKPEEDPTSVLDEASSDAKPVTDKTASEKPSDSKPTTAKSGADKSNGESTAKATTKGNAKSANIKPQKAPKGTEPKQAK